MITRQLRRSRNRQHLKLHRKALTLKSSRAIAEQAMQMLSCVMRASAWMKANPVSIYSYDGKV